MFCLVVYNLFFYYYYHFPQMCEALKGTVLTQYS